MKLVIADDEGNKRVFPFVGGEITIGRLESNTIPLPERNVSRHHARLKKENGHVLVEDLGSYNGIFINGQRVRSAVPVQHSDTIQIGDYAIAVVTEDKSTTDVDLPALVAPNAVRPPPPPPVSVPPLALEDATLLPDVASDLPTVELLETDKVPDSRTPTAIIEVTNLPSTEPPPAVTLAPEAAPHLVVLNTELRGREFACIRTELRLGRADDTDNDILLDHRSLSRTHARLRRRPNGDWWIHDTQSANGVFVNGEKYAETALKNGDVVMLGHVKLKFLMPGSHFALSYRPSVPMLSLAVVLVLAAAGGAALYLHPALLSHAPAWARVGPFKATESPGSESDDWLAHAPGWIPRVGPFRSPPPAAQAEPATAPASEAGSDGARLTGARAALSSGDYAGALKLLGELSTGGPESTEAERLSSAARHELAVGVVLADAQKALAHGQVSTARELVEGLHTDYQKASLSELVGKVKATEAEGSSPPSNETLPADPASEAPHLLDTAKALIGGGDYSQAVPYLERCLKADPLFLHCEAFLGAAFSYLKQEEPGAKHYRAFAEHAPKDDPAYAAELDQVRKILQQYESQAKPAAPPAAPPPPAKPARRRAF
jgi:pSer/pThr/pTyr-binding forkhead associated (FHA) protein